MTRLYPRTVVNRNVPDDVFLVADMSLSSGELHQTYYITRHGDMFVTGDWVTDKPQPVGVFKMCRITGDTERMITERWQAWLGEG